MSTRRLLVPALALVAACGASRLEPGTVALGTWGGQEAGLLVRADGAHAHIGCTYGDVTGIFHEARMSGRLTGRSLTFTAKLTDTGQSLGPVAVTRGREPTMANCPICRNPKPRGR
jgi:hypothetical protein